MNAMCPAKETSGQLLLVLISRGHYRIAFSNETMLDESIPKDVDFIEKLSKSMIFVSM